MVRVAEIGILSADIRASRGKLGVHERTDQGDDTTDDPGAEHERGSMDGPRDDARVDEDSGADDAAHHDHGRVERAEATVEGHLADRVVRAGYFYWCGHPRTWSGTG